MSDYGRELYPFLYDGDGTDLSTLLEEVRQSTRDKARTVTALREQMRIDHGADLVRCASALAERFVEGATLLAFGNGGSATDASDVVADCLAPPFPRWRALPAIDLTHDSGILTAIANDVGFDNVFSRQIIAYGRAGDIAVGFSTSGSSSNVVAALRRAHDDGLLTVAFAGYDGGEMAAADFVDHCFVARSDHIPRIQEGHATTWHALLAATQEALA